MKKKIKISSAGGVLLAGLILVMLFSSTVLASPPVVQLTTAKASYTLDEQVYIGMRITPVENWVGLAALFFKFESTAAHLADFNGKYWSVDGFHTEPRAVIPRTLPLHYYDGMDCTVHTSGPCFMSFPARALGAGTYTFHTLLMDRLGFAAAEFENSARLRSMTFSIVPGGAPITEQTLVGNWNFSSIDDGVEVTTGTWTFYPDNTLIVDQDVSDSPLVVSQTVRGVWEYSPNEERLTYQFTRLERIYTDGRIDEITQGLTTGNGIVSGDALNFNVVQTNDVIVRFNRR